MAETVTLELREHVIRSAREIAHNTHGRPDDVLAGWLDCAAGRVSAESQAQTGSFWNGPDLAALAEKQDIAPQDPSRRETGHGCRDG